MAQFSGTGVAVVTPFMSDGAVDHAALAGIINHLISGGMDYLVALGTTGETATLSSKEQNQVLDTFFATAAGRIPIVLGIGGNDTREVCEKIREWDARYQPAGILSVSPYYNKPTQEGIYRHYKAVAAATKLPIILYNVPPRTSSNVLPETVVRLAKECANIVAIKEASGSVAQGMELMAIKPTNFLVISGDDILATPTIAMGFDGLISVIANALPVETTTMVRLARAGEVKKAAAAHYQLQGFMNLCFVEGNPSGVKAAMEHLKLCTRIVRLPLVEASEGLASQLAIEIAHIRC